MAENYIKTTNFWSLIKDTYVKHNGVWERVNKQYIREDGAWQQIFDVTTDIFLLEIGSTSSTTYNSCTSSRTTHATFDREGNILVGVVNYYHDSTRDRIALISKWSPNGEFIWEQAFDTTQDCTTSLIDTDSDNNIYYFVKEGPSSSRMYKLSKTDGSIIWQRLYASVNSVFEFAINGNDDVIISGNTNYTGTSSNCGPASRARYVHKKISTSDGTTTNNGGGKGADDCYSDASSMKTITTDGTSFYGNGGGSYTNSPNTPRGTFGSLLKLNGSNQSVTHVTNYVGTNASTNISPTYIWANMTSLTNRTPSSIGHSVLLNQNYGGYTNDIAFLDSDFDEPSNNKYRIEDSDRPSPYRALLSHDTFAYRDGIVYGAVISTKSIINVFAMNSYGGILWNNKLEGVATYEVGLNSTTEGSNICRIEYQDGNIILVTVSANSTSAIDGNFSGNVIQVWKLPAEQMTETVTFGDGSYEYKPSTAITLVTGGGASYAAGFPGLSEQGHGSDSETARSNLSIDIDYYRYINE